MILLETHLPRLLVSSLSLEMPCSEFAISSFWKRPLIVWPEARKPRHYDWTSANWVSTRDSHHGTEFRLLAGSPGGFFQKRR